MTNLSHRAVLLSLIGAFICGVYYATQCRSTIFQNFIALKQLDERGYCDEVCNTSTIQPPQLASFKTAVQVWETRGTQGRIFYCLIRKVGSSNTLAWAEQSRLLHSTGTLNVSYEFNRTRARQGGVTLDRPDTLGQTLVLVRNPFVRLASGWRHWVKSGRKYKSYQNDFSGFVEHLLSLSENGTNWSKVDVHFRPQVLHCNLEHNKFAYELKLENPLMLACTLYSLSAVCPVTMSGSIVTGPFTGSTEDNLAEIYSQRTCVIATQLYSKDFQRFHYNSSACVGLSIDNNDLPS